MYKFKFRQKSTLFRFLLLFFFSNTYNAYADIADSHDRFTLNGFYTVDLSYSDSNLPIFSNGGNAHLLVENEATMVNSVFGLQARYDFTQDLSVFVQGITFFDRDNELDAALDWAYLSYDLGNDFLFRAGKFQIPLLQGTELKSIGYTRLWARPLVPSSGAGGYKNHSGVELIKNVALDNSNLDFQLAIGRPEHGLDIIDGKTLELISSKYENRHFWLRGALLHANYQISTPARQTLDDNAQVVMASLETEINYRDFIVNAGISDTRADFAPNDGLAYLSIAYRVANFTPYVLGKLTRQRFSAFEAPDQPRQQAAPNRLQAQTPPIRRNGDINRDSLSVGFRLDLKDNKALKFQWEVLSIDNGSGGEIEAQSERGNILSILLEGVF